MIIFIRGPKEAPKSPVSFNAALCCIECSGCQQKTPVSRHTLRNPHRLSEELSMAREVHEDCDGLEPRHATLRRTWREGMLREQYGKPERLAYSV